MQQHLCRLPPRSPQARTLRDRRAKMKLNLPSEDTLLSLSAIGNGALAAQVRASLAYRRPWRARGTATAPRRHRRALRARGEPAPPLHCAFCAARAPCAGIALPFCARARHARARARARARVHARAHTRTHARTHARTQARTRARCLTPCALCLGSSRWRRARPTRHCTSPPLCLSTSRWICRTPSLAFRLPRTAPRTRR
jgi:hypothetical protein